VVPCFEKDMAAGRLCNLIMVIAHCLTLDRVWLGDQRVRSE